MNQYRLRVLRFALFAKPFSCGLLGLVGRRCCRASSARAWRYGATARAPSSTRKRPPFLCSTPCRRRMPTADVFMFGWIL